MKTFDLDLSFKGSRQYIHGTDMLHKSSEQLTAFFNQVMKDVDFAVHRMTDSSLQLVLHPAAEVPALAEHDVAGLKFVVAERSWEARLVEKQERPDSRNPYDEESISRNCHIDQTARRITLHEQTSHTAIEIIVAMTKALHLTLFPEAEGSWVFCRWTGRQWPCAENLSGVSVNLIQALGTRLTRSEVRLADEILGNIYFSAKVNNK